MNRLTSLGVLAAIPAFLSAQDTTYSPANKLPQGREIVAVYQGAEDCGACHFPAVKTAVKRMKNLVKAQATKAGAAFSVIGLSSDWDPDVGYKYLSEVGPFDQIAAGYNWMNAGIDDFIWHDPKGFGAQPQIVIFERTVDSGGDRIVISAPRVLLRVRGGDSIPEWVARGAPIPMGHGTNAGSSSKQL